MQKSCSADKSTMYVDNIRQSSERMREMLNTLLDFFRLDNGKEQPNLSPCRISAIPCLNTWNENCASSIRPVLMCGS